MDYFIRYKSCDVHARLLRYCDVDWLDDGYDEIEKGSIMGRGRADQGVSIL